MTQEDQVRINYDAFKRMLPSLLRDRENCYALLRDGSLVDVYGTMPAAVDAAGDLFSDGRWSLQKITQKPVNLGYRSRALYSR